MGPGPPHTPHTSAPHTAHPARCTAAHAAPPCTRRDTQGHTRRDTHTAPLPGARGRASHFLGAAAPTPFRWQGGPGRLPGKGGCGVARGRRGMEACTPSCGMPGAAGCRRLLAGGGGAGPPGAAGSSDVAAGRVTLPALCSYQCETGLGRRLSVPLPAGSGGCAGAPGAQGRGRGEGGSGGSRPAPSRGCRGWSRCAGANPLPMSSSAPGRDAG